MSPATAESITPAPADDNIVRFPKKPPHNGTGIQSWRWAELPDNVVVYSRNRQNNDLASGEILAIALISALEKRSGLRTIADAVLEEVTVLGFTNPEERCRAVNVLCDLDRLAGAR